MDVERISTASAGGGGRDNPAPLGLSTDAAEGSADFINFRSEGRRFPKGRCLIPASHFFEFNGAKSPKWKWKFTKVGEDWFCFAGLWRPMPDGDREAFTLLTTQPGPDVAPIHNRQMVRLDRANWLAWLDLSRPGSGECRLENRSPRSGILENSRHCRVEHQW